MAVFDKRMHTHPPQPFSLQLFKDFDIADVQYFDINDLPELSEDRILKSPIGLFYKKMIKSDWIAYFD